MKKACPKNSIKYHNEKSRLRQFTAIHSQKEFIKTVKNILLQFHAIKRRWELFGVKIKRRWNLPWHYYIQFILFPFHYWLSLTLKKNISIQLRISWCSAKPFFSRTLFKFFFRSYLDIMQFHITFLRLFPFIRNTMRYNRIKKKMKI